LSCQYKSDAFFNLACSSVFNAQVLGVPTFFHILGGVLIQVVQEDHVVLSANGTIVPHGVVNVFFFVDGIVAIV